MHWYQFFKDISEERSFVHGLGHLAARLRERGFTPGFWLAPFVVQPGSRLAREHPDWLLRGRGGDCGIGVLRLKFREGLSRQESEE